MPAPEETKCLGMVGVRIKAARLEAGLSQSELGGDTYSRGFISQIECGNADPSLGSLVFFAARLDKPVSWFLEDTPLPDLPPPVKRPPKWSEATLTKDERELIRLYREGSEVDREYIMAMVRWVAQSRGHASSILWKDYYFQ